MSIHELKIVKTSLALTLVAIVQTQKTSQDKVSLDQQTLEDVYRMFDTCKTNSIRHIDIVDRKIKKCLLTTRKKNSIIPPHLV